MYDISPNTRFQVVYELGEFWSENTELKSMCADNLNLTWWSVTVTDDPTAEPTMEPSMEPTTEPTMEPIVGITEIDTDIESEAESAFVSDHILQSVREWSANRAMGPTLFVFIGLVAMLLLKAFWMRYRGVSGKKKLGINAVHQDTYGATETV